MRMHEDTKVTRDLPARDHVDLAVEVLRMLADATRLQLLWALLDGEMSVGSLAEAIGKSPTGVSQHLAKLRMARLLRTRRDGTQIIYRLENDHIRQLVLDAVFHAEHAGSGIPQHHRDDTSVAALAKTVRTGADHGD